MASGGKNGSSQTRTASPAASGRYSFLGGDPSVDFVNTVEDWLSEAPVDKFKSYGDLLDWSQQAGIVGSEVISSLRKAASECEQDSERVLQKARVFRGHMYRILAATAAGDPSAGKDLDAVTALARKAAAHSRLERGNGGFAWVLDEERGYGLDWPIWELARSAVSLLTSESLQRVRQCADGTCGWLFLDQSRNHSRRWCDMSSCGNRAKARRNYARQKSRRMAGQG